MEITFWEKINIRWIQTYYAEPAVIFCSLLATIIGIKHYRKELPYLALVIYSSACFFLFIGCSSVVIFYKYRTSPPSLTRAIVLQSLNILFSLLELSIFYYYYLKVIESGITRKIMKLGLILFVVIVIYSLIKLNNKTLGVFGTNQFGALFATIQFFLMLIPVFIYFIELFKNETVKQINQSPSTWITCGAFIYIIVTLPFLVISESLNKHLYLFMYASHYVSLCILLLTITKAFLCRKPITA